MQRNPECLIPGKNASRILSLVLLVLALVLFTAEPSFAGTETVLHNFNLAPNGFDPQAGLIADTAGDLYGTTAGGGAFGFGTVFKLTLKPKGGWKETVIYSFAGGADGAAPAAAPVFDQAGNLYGTTEYGGSVTCGCGTAFKLSPGLDGHWTETLIYAFQSEADGMWPTSSLVIDRLGNLLGTTSRGGSSEDYGFGTVFKLVPGSNGQWTKSTLYQFSAGSGPQDPVGSILDSSGNLYGASEGGGQGWGTIYELTPGSGGSWSVKVLHSFDGGDGAYPGAGLVLDSSGNLYGTTLQGPGVACSYTGCGVVFELSPQTGGNWSFQDLYIFEGGPDGAVPEAALNLDAAGNLYGTTESGGDLFGYQCYECGTVFELFHGSTDTWTEQVLFRFNEQMSISGEPTFPIGGASVGSLIFDKAGNLYGTNPLGGPRNSYGTVFELTQNGHGQWMPKVLNVFGQKLDGTGPGAALSSGEGGVFYGTTPTGGVPNGTCAEIYSLSCGAVFEVEQSKEGWKEKLLYSFAAGLDGATPTASVAGDGLGNLYGTTTAGGKGCSTSHLPGCGTVFELAPSKRGWKERVIYRFAGGSDGAYPATSLTFDQTGNLYGVTSTGGGCTVSQGGCGTVFELMPSGGRWTEKVLYSFQGGTDGSYPSSPLLFDALGNLYGTASWGGQIGCGNVFRLSPASGDTWSETVLYSFTNQNGDGCNPLGNLAFDSQGNLFGTTNQGGDYNADECSYVGCGTVFELTPGSGSWVESVIDAFNSNDGAFPGGGVSLDSLGNIYVAVSEGGSSGNDGTLVELTSAGNGTWNESVLYDFGGVDGNSPNGPLVLDSAGNLYGTTTSGGAVNLGTVFEYSPGEGGRTRTRRAPTHRSHGSSSFPHPIGLPPRQRPALGSQERGDAQ